MLISNYEEQMVYHCAPTLKGIKAGSMVAMRVSSHKSIEAFFAEYQECFKVHGIEYMKLTEQKQHVLVLIYRPDMLSRMLRRPMAREILGSYGYPVNDSLKAMLNHLQKRIDSCSGFPHEIGLFLGYPPQDVQGFIRHKGHNFLFCGFWKVYANGTAVKRLFRCYNECIHRMCRRLLAGESLQEVIRAA